MERNDKERGKIRILSEELGLTVVEVARAKLEGDFECPEQGLVFPLRRIRRAKKSSEKAAVLFLLTQELIKQNRKPGEVNSIRNILQEGGPLRQGEWIATVELPDKKDSVFWGTRGSGKIEKKLP